MKASKRLFILIALLVSMGCENNTQQKILKDNYRKVEDSLHSEGYILHQNLQPQYFHKAISDTLIIGNLSFSNRHYGDTIIRPKTLTIRGFKFKKVNQPSIELYQFHFLDSNEKKAFDTFIPYSSFHLSNVKTPGTYFYNGSILYLTLQPFP